jgi:hypothetical protein
VLARFPTALLALSSTSSSLYQSTVLIDLDLPFRHILLPLCLGTPMVLLLQFTYTFIFEEIGVVASSGCITSVDNVGRFHYYNIERDNAGTILI